MMSAAAAAATVTLLLSTAVPVLSFNGNLADLECPDDCDCHYFRVNWVTDCSDSNLTEIPYSELSPNVYVLDLNGNLISEVPPFPPDIKVRRLQIAHNALTAIKRESYAGLGYLLDADFSSNYISHIDSDAFDDSLGLITLELQGNPLAAISGQFLTSRSLMYLDISNCRITNLNSDFFMGLTALSTLILSGNPLRAIEMHVFQPLENLETLYLNHCNLTNIADSALVAQRNLKSLELSGNYLTDTDWSILLGNLVRLEHLDLRNSKVTHLPDDVFANNVWIRTLILAENQLSDLDVATTLGQNLRHLHTLDLTDCKLTGPLSEDAFANATKLQTLYLSGNPMFASDLFIALEPLENLQKLSLRNCGLRHLSDTFHIFTNLQELDISHNPLEYAFTKLLKPLHSLEYLNMAYSNLSYISPDTFSKMTSMKRLVLSGNDLNSLEAGLFGNLTHLESLELNFCGLRRPLNATVFFNNLTYTDLTELQLAGNPLQVSQTGPLLPKQLSRLKILDISNCNITNLPSDAFHWTRNITKLDMAGNRISSKNGTLDFLQLLPELMELDLRFNNLTTLSPKLLSGNLHINSLKLIGNPWKCDCQVADLWDWAQLEKRNLGMLEGSTTAEQHIKAGGAKRKNALMCTYDSTQPMPLTINKTVAGRRGFKNPARVLTTVNRTWAKYVRESGCEPLPKLLRQTRSVTTDVRDEAVAISAARDHGPNTWIKAAVNACAVYGVLISVLAVAHLIPSHNTLRKAGKQH